MYDSVKSVINFDSSVSQFFDLHQGVKQGDPLKISVSSVIQGIELH